MEDKRKLEEKELLNVAGGNSVQREVMDKLCSKYNKEECKKHQDMCKWLGDQGGVNRCRVK